MDCPHMYEEPLALFTSSHLVSGLYPDRDICPRINAAIKALI